MRVKQECASSSLGVGCVTYVCCGRLGNEENLPAAVDQGTAVVLSAKPPCTRRNRSLACRGLGRRAALNIGNQPIKVGKGTLPIPWRQRSREVKHGQLP